MEEVKKERTRPAYVWLTARYASAVPVFIPNYTTRTRSTFGIYRPLVPMHRIHRCVIRYVHCLHLKYPGTAHTQFYIPLSLVQYAPKMIIRLNNKKNKQFFKTQRCALHNTRTDIIKRLRECTRKLVPSRTFSPFKNPINQRQ